MIVKKGITWLDAFYIVSWLGTRLTESVHVT